MHSNRLFAIAALVAGNALSVVSAVAQDDVFVAQDGVNTGSIGAYSISFDSGSLSSSTINSSLITSPAAGSGVEVRMSLATDGQGDLFVGEWATGSTTATVGEYSLNGTLINSSFLTFSGHDSVPQLASDGQGHLFVAVGDTISEYNTGGTLLNSFSLTQAPNVINIGALAVDSSGDVYTAYSTGDEVLGDPYHGVIGEYTASGSAISRSLIETPNFINALTVGGGDIYVSIQDGPPDLVNRVDEYTTGGGTVASPLISGMTGHTALDGQGHLLLDSYGDGTVNAYTTSGTLLGSDVITGAGGAEDMVVIVPEPSSLALLAVGAMGLLVRRRS